MDGEKSTQIFEWNANPFTFKISPELFVGYNNVVDVITNNLYNGDKASLLLGPTGSGKTTLLKSLISKFDEKGYNVIYLPKPPKNPEDWIAIFDSVIKPGFFSSLFSHRNAINLYDLYEHVNRKLKNKKCILLVDECHEASLDSLEWLRTFIDQIDNISVLLAGLPVLETILKDNLETFMRRINTRAELTNLTKSETRELIKKRVESMGGEDTKPFTYNTIEHIYERTGGFPREIIRFCNDLVIRAIEKKITIIDLEFIKETETPESRVSLETVSELPERQRIILETLSKTGESTPSEIISNMKLEEYKNRENAVRSVNNLLRRLMTEGLVERKRRGKTYKYRVSSKFQTLMVNA